VIKHRADVLSMKAFVWVICAFNIQFKTKKEYTTYNAATVRHSHSLWAFLAPALWNPPPCVSGCNQRTQTLATAAHAHSLVLSLSLFLSLSLPHPAMPSPVVPDDRPTSPGGSTSRAVHPLAILRSVTLASHDILSHRQPHSSSVSSCEGAWDPATGGGHFKGRPAHSCSLSLQQPAPVCNHY